MRIKHNSIVFGNISINPLAWVGATKTKFKKHYKEKLTGEQIDSAWKVIRSSK